MTRTDPLRRTRRVTGAAAIALLVAMLVPALSAGAGVRNAPTSVVVGEYPGEAPNYIFPFTPCAHYDVANLQDFQQLMYRPLYWFGLGASRAEQPTLSPASQPVFTATSVTIKLKGWKFANGTSVDAASVEFFLNLWKAEPSHFCGTSNGTAIPGQVANVTGAPNGSTVVIQFTKAVALSNPNVQRWLLDDYLSQITPLPTSWDTATGCAAPGFNNPATLSACATDWSALDTKAHNLITYGDAFWNAGVDGPYRLSSFADGDATLVPNPTYSGPQKAQLTVSETPYASMSSELADLEAQNLQIGYVDPSALPGAAPTPGTVGPNAPALAPHFQLEADPAWAYDSVLYNYSSGDPMGAVLSQAYVRQALTDAVNATGMQKAVYKNYAYPDCSSNPPLVDASLSAAVPCAYPYSATKAKALLAANGWTLQGGVMTCTNPGTAAGDCGAGIPNNQQLSLTIEYSSGVPSTAAVMAVVEADLNAIGVQLTPSTAPYDTVHQQCGGSTFELCWWDGGQVYAPSVYPAGDQIYATGGQANLGGYSSAALDSSIVASHTGSLTKYASLVAKTVPSLLLPDQVLTLEVARTIKFTNAAASAPNPYEDFQPEYMTYSAPPPPPTPTCQGKGACDVAAASPQVICLTSVGCPAVAPRAGGPCGTLNNTTTCVGVTAYVNGRPAAGRHVTVHFLSPSTPSSSTGSWCQPQGVSPPVTTVSGTTGARGVFYFPYTTTGTVATATISSFCIMRAVVGKATIIMAIDETNDPAPYVIKATPRHMLRFAVPTFKARVHLYVNDPVNPPPNAIGADPTAIISEIPSTVGACGAVSPLVRKTSSAGLAVLVYTPSSIYGTKKHPASCTVIAQEAVTSSKSNRVVIVQEKP